MSLKFFKITEKNIYLCHIHVRVVLFISGKTDIEDSLLNIFKAFYKILGAWFKFVLLMLL